jgi:hypothetical protein
VAFFAARGAVRLRPFEAADVAFFVFPAFRFAM